MDRIAEGFAGALTGSALSMPRQVTATLARKMSHNSVDRSAALTSSGGTTQLPFGLAISIAVMATVLVVALLVALKILNGWRHRRYEARAAETRARNDAIWADKMAKRSPPPDP